MRLRVDEMHLADDACHVTGAAQVVSEGFNAERPRLRVVVRLVMMRVQTGQERGPRGNANRKGAVGVVEMHPAAGQSIEVRRVRHRIAGNAQGLPRVLV